MIQNLHEILYSNKAIVKHRNINWGLILIIFFFSVMMVSAPFITQGYRVDSKDIAPIYEPMAQLFQEVLEEDCTIENNTLSCNFSEVKTFESNGYKVYLNQSDDVSLKDMNKYLMLTEHYVAAQVDTNNVIGTYALANIGALSNLKTSDLSESMILADFLENAHKAALPSRIPLIYALNLFQYLVYILIVALVLRFVNGKQFELNLSFKQALAIAVMTMFSPALITAVIGLFNPSVATLAFPIIYMGRIVMVYWQIMKAQRSTS